MFLCKHVCKHWYGQPYSLSILVIYTIVCLNSIFINVTSVTNSISNTNCCNMFTRDSLLLSKVLRISINLIYESQMIALLQHGLTSDAGSRQPEWRRRQKQHQRPGWHGASPLRHHCLGNDLSGPGKVGRWDGEPKRPFVYQDDHPGTSWWVLQLQFWKYRSVQLGFILLQLMCEYCIYF